MPKEVIANPDGGFHVGVGWSKGQSLQAGLMADEAVIGLEDELFKSLWADLDRHRTNELIRTLRRARDQAFGHDE